MNWFQTVYLFLGSLLAGLYASNVGGGALVNIPLLILTGIPIHNVIATSRFTAVFIEGTSALRFGIKKQLDFRLGLLFGVSAAIGSWIGSSLAITIQAEMLNLFTAILITVLGAFLMRKKEMGIKEHVMKKHHYFIGVFASFFLGIYGGLFGAAFGTMMLFLLVYLGFSFLKAAANARLIGLLMSGTSAAIFIMHGLVRYEMGIPMAIGTALGSWIGVGLGIKGGNRYVRILFLILILISAIQLIYKTLF